MKHPPFRICGLIPCFNNGETVGTVVAKMVLHLGNVVVVDDGSTDGGPASLQQRPGLTVLRHDHNRGKGAAVMTGMAWAKDHGFTHVLQIDADGQHDTDDIPRFAARAEQAPVAVVAGERIWDDNAPRSSRFGHKFGMFWYKLETGGHHLQDTQCGFRVYPVSVLDTLYLRGRHMDFDVEILVRSVWANIEVIGMPTKVKYEKDHLSHFRPFWDNVLFTGLHTRLFTKRIISRVGRTFGLAGPRRHS